MSVDVKMDCLTSLLSYRLDGCQQ